jgi:hypothetical protein
LLGDFDPEDIVKPLTKLQLDGIRRRVLAATEAIKTGKYTEYDGRDDLRRLADQVKARGRKLLSQTKP